MISPWDRGFLYGDGVFETLRTYGRRLFALDDHLELLAATAATLRIEAPGEVLARLRGEALAAVAAAEGEQAVRLVLTRGEGAGAALAARTGPTALALAEALPALPEALHRDGITAETRPAPGGTLGPKTLSYLPQLRALDGARQRGHGEVLWRDEEGGLGQGSMSNLLVALPDGELVAPSPAGGRAGVTRRWTLRHARGLGLRVAERPVSPDDLERATEAMVCSTLREVVAVVAVDGVPIGSGRPGELSRALLGALRQAARGIAEA